MNWFKTGDGRKLIWGEFLRFKTYGARGDFPIVNWCIEDIMQGHTQLNNTKAWTKMTSV